MSQTVSLNFVAFAQSDDPDFANASINRTAIIRERSETKYPKKINIERFRDVSRFLEHKGKLKKN